MISRWGRVDFVPTHVLGEQATPAIAQLITALMSWVSWVLSSIWWCHVLDYSLFSIYDHLLLSCMLIAMLDATYIWIILFSCCRF
jgi:hypothetical protein